MRSIVTWGNILIFKHSFYNSRYEPNIQIRTSKCIKEITFFSHNTLLWNNSWIKRQLLTVTGRELTDYYYIVKPTTLYFRYNVKNYMTWYYIFFFYFAGYCSLHWKKNKWHNHFINITNFTTYGYIPIISISETRDYTYTKISFS